MKREWWNNSIFYPAWWLLDKALDGAFRVWDAWDKSAQRWEKR